MYYCAIESFINYKIQSESDEKRLSEKLRDLVATTFPNIDLAKHSIYTSIIKEFDQLTGLRNMIAHGATTISLSKQESCLHLILVLTLIACVEKAEADFSSLAAVLPERDLSLSSARFWSSWKDDE